MSGDRRKPDFPMPFVLEGGPPDPLEDQVSELERRACELEEQCAGFTRELAALAELLRKRNAN